MTTFGGSSLELDEEEKDALFGDLYDVPLEAEEAEEAEEVVAEEPEEDQPEGTEDADVEVVADEAPEEPSTPEEPEPALDQTDWKTRYDDLRREEMAALQRERDRAAAAEEQLAVLVAQRQQPRVTEQQLQAWAAKAEQLGLEPEQIALLTEINLAANPQDDTMVNYLARQADEARASAAQVLADQEAHTLAAFRDAHPNLDAETQQGVGRFMHDVGAAVFLDQYGNELPPEMPYEQKLAYVSSGQASMNSWPPDQPLQRAALELAYEAVSNPDLGFILRANPVLCETDDGIEWAREQASQRAAQRGVTTLPTPAKTPEEIAASVAAAETLGGTSGLEPMKSEPQFLDRGEPKHFAK